MLLRTIRRTGLAIAAALAVVGLGAACGSDEPSAGERMEEAADTMAENIEEAGDEAAETLEETEEEVRDEVDDHTTN